MCPLIKFQRVAVLVRAQSVNKTIPQKLKASGAEIRVGDASDSPEKIEAFLQGVDVVISTIHQMFVDQRPLLLAAKKVGVGRVIPSDFGTTAPKGVMEIHDLVRIQLFDSSTLLMKYLAEIEHPGIH